LGCTCLTVLVIFVGFDISTPKYDNFHLFIPWSASPLGAE